MSDFWGHMTELLATIIQTFFFNPVSRYICVIKTNFLHYLSSVYFINQRLHVSGIFVAHHQEVYCLYTTTGTWLLTVCWPANRQATKKHNTYQLLYICSISPDDGLQICPKHVEVDWQNKLRINSAESWFLLHRIIQTFVSCATRLSSFLPLWPMCTRGWQWKYKASLCSVSFWWICYFQGYQILAIKCTLSMDKIIFSLKHFFSVWPSLCIMWYGNSDTIGQYIVSIKI
jgi:hypothetical protein